MAIYANKSASHGTMRNEDLLSAFASELRNASGVSHRHLVLADEADALVELGNADTDDGSDVVHELFDALQHYAPEGCVFGSHEGDGSDYGFWCYEPDDTDEDDERRAFGITALD